jgi:hypothetical protein
MTDTSKRKRETFSVYNGADYLDTDDRIVALIEVALEEGDQGYPNFYRGILADVAEALRRRRAPAAD